MLIVYYYPRLRISLKTKMSICPISSSSFNRYILQPRMDVLQDDVYEIVKNHSYTQESPQMNALYFRVAIRVDSVIRIIKDFFREIGVESQANLAPTPTERIHYVFLVLTHSHIQDEFASLLKRNIRNISEYDLLMSYLNTLMWLARMCVKPFTRQKKPAHILYVDNVTENVEEPCSICFETFTKENAVITCCNHTFCKVCYCSHEKSIRFKRPSAVDHIITCPLCRTEISSITVYQAPPY